MSNQFKPIAISLLPNLFWKDFFKKENPVPENTVWFESGRGAEYFLLKALDMGMGDEVIIQAFTCVAVPNSILWTGAKPVFIDIDESLNMDPEKLLKAITPKTKAVIFQSTFGNPGQIKKIKEICEKNKIFFIEDGAHSGKVIGDLGFLSFGRDKAISGLYGGGAAIINNQETRDKIQIEKLVLKKYFLFYPLIIYFILQTYSFFNLGKILHKLLKNFLPKVLTPEEKQGERPEKFYSSPPIILTKDFTKHRKEIAKFYAEKLREKFDDNSSYLRFSIFVNDPDGLRKYAAKQNIFLGDWYDNVVAPKGVNLEKIGYKIGSCSKAEEVCKNIVNLPTNPNMTLQDAEKVIKIVKDYERLG